MDSRRPSAGTVGNRWVLGIRLALALLLIFYIYYQLLAPK